LLEVGGKYSEVGSTGANENWVYLSYFPMYSVGNHGRNIINGVDSELAGKGFPCDPYLELSRIGNTFFFKTSPDGGTYTSLPGLEDGVVRDDLPETVQVGIWQANYNGDWQTTMDFDNFIIETVPELIPVTVIGDFEDGFDGWTGAWAGTEDLGNSTIGATLNSQSMSVLDGPSDNFWKLQRDGQLNLVGATAIAADFTFVASEWPDPNSWLNVHKLCIQDHTTWAWQEVDLPAITVTKVSGADVQAPDADGNRAWWKPELGDATWTVSWSLEGKTLSDDVYSLFIALQNTKIAKDVAGLIYVDNVRVVGVAPAEPLGKIIFVTSVKDNDADGIQDDQSWADWLTAEGYDVDFRPGNWIDPLDANEIAELEAADLVIASRGMATGDYDGAETDKWNALSTPVLCTNAWMIRSNRWVWMNSTAANKDAGAPLMLVLDATHPIFAGVPVDSDGLVDVLDPTVASGNTSFLNDILDAGNGTLLAQSLGIYNTAWIVEWEAGVEYYAGAGQIAGGERVLFMAGTQDDPYTVESGLIQPVGVFNLNEAGQQLLRNILTYMIDK
jgi:hypothetical protein